MAKSIKILNELRAQTHRGKHSIINTFNSS